MMEEPQKPFACNLPDCGMTFTNEDHLHVHTRKHDMVLQLGLEQKTAFVADQTPTPTRFIRNCEEVGLFQDLQNVTENPFDEGFKKAMETKHGILSLESAIAPSASDDVLHTPQMMYPLIDSGDSALFTSSNHRNVTISRSSSDETGTIREYETTTISKLTNEVTTISRVIGHRETDKTDEPTKNDVNETVFTNNVVKVQIRKDDKQCSVPVVVYTDTFKNQNDGMVMEHNKLKVPDAIPPIMSQRSLEVLVDSLTSELTDTSKHTKSDSTQTSKQQRKNRKVNVVKRSNVKRVRLAPKLPETASTINKQDKSNDFEVIIKMPNGKQMRMKAVEEIRKEETKELLRKTLNTKKERNNVHKKMALQTAKVMPIPNVLNAVNTPIVQKVYQIPTGTLIPVTLVNQCIVPSIPTEPPNVEAFISNPPKASKTAEVAVTDKNNPVILTKVTKTNPFSHVKISQPYEIDSTGEKKAVNDVFLENGTKGMDKDDDCVIEKVSHNEEVVRRTRFELESRCAASKRYRERLKEAMAKQAQENKQLRDINIKLVAEKAMLKLLITEHMKRCPNADDLRVTQEKLKNQNQ